MAVPEIDKRPGVWCPHCLRGKGCAIYADRPGACRTFLCGWLTNPRFGPEWKPDRSKIVITVDRHGNGLHFQCDPGFPDAWRKEPYYSHIKNLAAIAARYDGLISVNAGKNCIIVAADCEFAIGAVGDRDEIIREYSGSRLVGVRVIRAGETH
jgi:hypothetical protein